MKHIKASKLSVLTFAIMVAVVGLVFAISSTKGYAAPLYQATCSISNVPSTLEIGASMTATLTVTNTGTATLHPHMITPVGTNDGPTTYLKELAMGTIKPGDSKTKELQQYTAEPGTPTGPAALLSHSDLNFTGTNVFFQCVKDFSITS